MSSRFDQARDPIFDMIEGILVEPNKGNYKGVKGINHMDISLVADFFVCYDDAWWSARSW